jgi:hypothetical protein
MIESYEIGEKPLFVENFYKGLIKTDKGSYGFWLTEVESFDKEADPISIRWFASHVPKEVRAMESSIIAKFKNRV